MSQTFILNSNLTLRDGNSIPVLGFGTYELEGKDSYNAVTWALEAGYRHIDCAEWYYNEKEVGTAILDFCKEQQVPRSEIYYTTKLHYNIDEETTKKEIQKSLEQCGLDYIDLYLIHGPEGGPAARAACWKAILDVKKEGKIRSAGVSNFGVRHLKELSDAGLEAPVVNQIDLHPFMTRTDLVEFCKRNEIALEAWGPLVRAYRFKHPILVQLSEKYSKSVPQILLRYSLQKGFIPLPKSTSKERIISNTQLFDFEMNDVEIKELDSLDEHLITDWDPSDCP